jgi:hypothetical protein
LKLLLIRMVVDVVEERVYGGRCARCGKVHYGEFSEGFVNPVQYGSNVKTLIALLNGYPMPNATPISCVICRPSSKS